MPRWFGLFHSGPSATKLCSLTSPFIRCGDFNLGSRRYNQSSLNSPNRHHQGGQVSAISRLLPIQASRTPSGAPPTRSYLAVFSVDMGRGLPANNEEVRATPRLGVPT